MDLRQLETFRVVANTLSFTHAATALNYAQSSVSAQIQALEKELGAPLFNRVNKRVELTDAGRRLLRYADRLLEIAEEARAVVGGDEEPMGTLTIAAPETVCTYRLPPVLRQFRERYPHVLLVYRPVRSTSLQRAVINADVDIAFWLSEPVQAASLVIEPLIEEPLALIAAPDHPLASRARVLPADLECEPLLLTERGCNYRTLFERALTAAGVIPATNFEFDSVEAIKQCVIANVGIAVLPAVTVQREMAEGKLVALPWDQPDFRVLTMVMRHKDKWLSPAMRAFLGLARDLLAGTPEVEELEAALP
jgi:DNA-binding transcriptional LysR family regulator